MEQNASFSTENALFGPAEPQLLIIPDSVKAIHHVHHMIIAYTAGGRTGNQLYHFLYLLAASLEFGFSFKLIAFESCGNFDFMDDPKRRCSWHPWLIFFIRKLRRLCMERPFRILARACGWTYIIERGVSPSTTSELAGSEGKLIMLDCWPYIEVDLLKKHSEEARRYVQPRREAREKATGIINTLRSCANLPVVGVHIRRTDYKEWLGGKYFYELDTYQRYMKRVSELMNGKVAFLICSDEPHNEADFADVPCDALYVSHESFMTDFALLSQCDYTMGPPSTFRMTASFLGNTPSFRILAKDTPLPSMEAFTVPLIGEQV